MKDGNFLALRGYGRAEDGAITVRILTWGSLFLLLSIGCSEVGPTRGPSEPTSTDGSCFPAPTVHMLLGNLKTVYETRDSQYFELLFNQNEFGFEFDPTDIERDPAIPSSWSWREERAATEKLFQDPDVVSIQLDFQSTDPEALREYEIDEYPPGTLRVIASNVELSVTIQNAGSEEPTTYEVTGDRALFFVVENPDRIVNCRPAWEIVGWRDEVQGQSENEPSARPTSWGGMKWYWSQMTIHR